MTKKITNTMLANVLKGTRDLFTDKAKWTKHTDARLPNGNSTDYDDREASCFCLGGGIMVTAKKLYPKADAYEVVQLARPLMGFSGAPGESLPRWNDEPARKQIDVLNILDFGVLAAGGTI